jgi:hypothetical protein
MRLRKMMTWLQKSHQISKVALTVSYTDDSEDIEIVSCMRTNELARWQ